MRAKVKMTDDWGPYRKNFELTMSREQADRIIADGAAEEMKLPPREVPPAEVTSEESPPEEDSSVEESETKE